MVAAAVVSAAAVAAPLWCGKGCLDDSAVEGYLCERMQRSRRARCCEALLRTGEYCYRMNGVETPFDAQASRPVPL